MSCLGKKNLKEKRIFKNFFRTNGIKQYVTGPPVCGETVCPVWSPWSDWTDCSASCGGGVRRAARECAVPELERRAGDCPGEPEREETCNSQACPVWADWTDWTACTVRQATTTYVVRVDS